MADEFNLTKNPVDSNEKLMNNLSGKIENCDSVAENCLETNKLPSDTDKQCIKTDANCHSTSQNTLPEVTENHKCGVRTENKSTVVCDKQKTTYNRRDICKSISEKKREESDVSSSSLINNKETTVKVNEEETKENPEKCSELVTSLFDSDEKKTENSRKLKYESDNETEENLDSSYETVSDQQKEYRENKNYSTCSTSQNNIELQLISDDPPSVVEKTPPQKYRKTYEKRKTYSESLSNIEKSPLQNRSRYGRTRKPKITEDFYNIEDIFGPYEKINASPPKSPKKKSTKLDLSPNKNHQDLNLSIKIPDESLEMSKVMKIVSNNSSVELSPKSPKVIKTYSNRNKNSFVNGARNMKVEDVSDCETDESVNKYDILQNTILLSDDSLSDCPSSDKRTKVKSNAKKSSKINLKCSLDDSITLAKSAKTKLEHEENESSLSETSNSNEDIKDHDVHYNFEESELYQPKIGSLAWSRVGSYPFWPSIVTNEPEKGRHSRTVIMFGKQPYKYYHVHFFGDNGRRSWVLGSHIFPFHQRSDLEIMAQSVSKYSKPKDPKHLSAFIINPNKLKTWETAVTEAESLTNFSAKVRLEKFFEMVKPKAKKVSSPSIKTPKINMRNELMKKKSSKKKKYKAKKIAEQKQMLKTKTNEKIKIKEEIEEPNEEDDSMKISKNIKKSEISINFEDSKSVVISDDSFSESDIKDIKSNDIPLIKIEPRETPSPQPIVSQLQKQKKLNLFRGVTRDRACQICGKNQNVYKCKGCCFGFYHIECDKKIRMKLSSQLTEEKISDTDSLCTEDLLTSRNDNIYCKKEFGNKLETSNDSNINLITENKIETIEENEIYETNQQPDNLCDKNYCTSSEKAYNNESKNPLADDYKNVTVKNEVENNKDIPSLILEEILENVFRTADKKDCDFEQNQENATKNVKIDVIESTEKEVVRSLSIAEQIDLKMQEVMRNLITQTKYTDSTTDEGSENEDEPSRIDNDFQENEKCTTNLDMQEGKTQKVTKKIIKHVTADGLFDVIEEEIDREDFSSFKCTYCTTGVQPPCFICNKDFSASGDGKKHKCVTAQCGKYYHSECLKDWPQTKWNQKIDNETLSCPNHNCHTCISDNPRGPLSRYIKEKLAKCIRCPTTYHISNYCIPAGTEILSAYQIICPKHLQEEAEEDIPSSPSSTSKKIVNKLEKTNGGKLETSEPKKSLGGKTSKVGAVDGTKKSTKVKIMQHVNASWCFICSMGGSLICCETCPSSFHVECLKLVPPEGRYLCEECEAGRLPLYDEIVWVKLGSYRWWPAQILFPSEIPPNLQQIPHAAGEFVVRFFGSHDHYWVNRGRVFLFQEGDTGHASSKKSVVDGLFVKAIEEATKAHKEFVVDRANRAAEARNGMKPPSYIKIKVNRPVGNVRSADADTSNTTPCDCDPNWEFPCGPDSDCLNRILMTECNPMVCAAGSRCCNQLFEKRLYAPAVPFKTSGRGWGLKTLAPVKKGSFVIEYVGEVINEKEYRRRMKRKHEHKDENYYFLTIDKDRMIDAGPKGNAARFMNHSCSPNCETQKWRVNGDTRVGLFAIMDIPTGTELTFNYNLECIGEEKKECRCGAPNCSGFIGAKAKQDEMNKKRKSLLKQKKKKPIQTSTVKLETNDCFVCGEPDAIQHCDREACNKFYHLHCVNLENYQEGKWICPWHSCNICTKRTTRCCYMCVNSFCPLHSEGNIRYDRIKGFICTIHDSKDEEIKEAEVISEDKIKFNKTKKQTKLHKMEIRSSTESSKNSEESTEFSETISSIKTTTIKEDSPINNVSSSEISQSCLPESEEENSCIKESGNLSSSSNNEETKKTPVKTSAKKSTRYSKTNSEINKIQPNKKISKEICEELNKDTENSSDDETPLLKSVSTIEDRSNSFHKPESAKSNTKETTEGEIVKKTNSTIKKRKSRLSLRQIEIESSNSSLDDFSEDDKPLVKLKKRKLSPNKKDVLKCEDSKQLKQSVDSENTLKPKILRSGKSFHQNDLDSSSNSNTLDSKLELKSYFKNSKRKTPSTDTDTSDNSDSDFVSSPRKSDKYVKKGKKFKIVSPQGQKEKQLRNIKNNITLEQNKNLKSEQKLSKTTEKVELKSKKQKANLCKTENLEEIIENENKVEHIQKKPKLNSLIKQEISLTINEELKTLKVNLEKDLYTALKSEENRNESSKIKDAGKSKKFNLSLRKNDAAVIKNEDGSENTKKVKVFRTGVRKSLRNSKQFGETSLTDCDLENSNLTETTISSAEELETTIEDTSSDNQVSKKNKLKLGFRKSLRLNVEEKIKVDEITTETESDHDNEETVDVPRRKRGRPRKYPVSTTETKVEVVKRPIGRPRKHKILPEESKNSEVLPVFPATSNKNPYENHVTEVKLTANVPERHLRVVLRKSSEIDSKIDSKFLKMQNDIERDLPIRKRSKLRYEAQL